MSSVFTNNPLAGKSRRTTMVWGSFMVAMTLVGGILILTDPNPAPDLHSGRSLAGLFATVDSKRTVIDTATPIDYGRWDEIIIEDSGQPHGSIESIARAAQARGLEGFPQHFLIGNGHGMGDGALHLGYRWNTQKKAAPIATINAEGSVEGTEDGAAGAIRICLVGNLENRPFTTPQLERLAALVAGLQRELGIPASRVRFQSGLNTPTNGGEGNFDRKAFNILVARAANSG